MVTCVLTLNQLFATYFDSCHVPMFHQYHFWNGNYTTNPWLHYVCIIILTLNQLSVTPLHVLIFYRNHFCEFRKNVCKTEKYIMVTCVY